MKASLLECFPDPLTPAWPLTTSPINCEARQIYAITAIACCVPGAHVLLLHEQENMDSVRSCIAKEFRFLDFQIEPTTTVEQITNFLVAASEVSLTGRGPRSSAGRYSGPIASSMNRNNVFVGGGGGGVGGGYSTGGFHSSAGPDDLTMPSLASTAAMKASFTEDNSLIGAPAHSESSFHPPPSPEPEAVFSVKPSNHRGKSSSSSGVLSPGMASTPLITFSRPYSGKKPRWSGTGATPTTTPGMPRAKSSQFGGTTGSVYGYGEGKGVAQPVVACIRAAHVATPVVLETIMDAVHIGQMRVSSSWTTHSGVPFSAGGRREDASAGRGGFHSFDMALPSHENEGEEPFSRPRSIHSSTPHAVDPYSMMEGRLGNSPLDGGGAPASLLPVSSDSYSSSFTYALPPTVHIVLFCSQKCYTELLSESDRAAFALSMCISVLNVNQLNLLYPLNLRHSSFLNKKHLQEVLASPESLDTVSVSAMVSGYLRHLLLVIRGSALPGDTVGGFVMRYLPRYLRLIRAAALLFYPGGDFLAPTGSRHLSKPSSSASFSSPGVGNSLLGISSMRDSTREGTPVGSRTQNTPRNTTTTTNNNSGSATAESSVDTPGDGNHSLLAMNTVPGSLFFHSPNPSHSGVRSSTFADVVVTPTDVLCLLSPMIVHLFFIRVAQLQFLLQSSSSSSSPSALSRTYFAFPQDGVSSHFDVPKGGSFSLGSTSHKSVRGRSPHPPSADGPPRMGSFFTPAGSPPSREARRRASHSGSLPKDYRRPSLPHPKSGRGHRRGSERKYSRDSEGRDIRREERGGSARLSFSAHQGKEESFSKDGSDFLNARQHANREEMNPRTRQNNVSKGELTSAGPEALSYAEVREFLRYVIIRYSNPTPG